LFADIKSGGKCPFGSNENSLTAKSARVVAKAANKKQTFPLVSFSDLCGEIIRENFFEINKKFSAVGRAADMYLNCPSSL
jgi:hypothetical protein